MLSDYDICIFSIFQVFSSVLRHEVAYFDCSVKVLSLCLNPASRRCDPMEACAQGASLTGMKPFWQCAEVCLGERCGSREAEALLEAPSLFLTVTGSAGTQNIIYSQWTVVLFFFGFKLCYSCLLFFLYNQSQERDFIGLTSLTLKNIHKIKFDVEGALAKLREFVMS